MSALLTWDHLKTALKAHKAKGEKVVFTNGCFDLLHKGHVAYLEAARNLGDVLVVAINSDASVRRLNKGPERPINQAEDRAAVLNGLRAVTYTTIFDQDTPLELIKTLNPDVLVKGGDWAIEQIVGADHVLALGGEVYSLPFVDGYSTTGIVKKLRA